MLQILQFKELVAYRLPQEYMQHDTFLIRWLRRELFSLVQLIIKLCINTRKPMVYDFLEKRFNIQEAEEMLMSVRFLCYITSFIN
jgi:hypothetical protein